MAHTWVRMEDRLGRIRTAPIGFSWWALLCAVFFATFIPPLIRGQWAMAFVTALLTILTAGVYGLIYPFIDYVFYRAFLYNNGYRPVSVYGKMSQEEVEEATGWSFLSTPDAPTHRHLQMAHDQSFAVWCNGQRPSGSQSTKCCSQLFRCRKCGSSGCLNGNDRPCSNAAFKKPSRPAMKGLMFKRVFVLKPCSFFLVYINLESFSNS